MNNAGKCRDCKYLKYRGEEYLHPYKCKKYIGVTCSDADIKSLLTKPCEYFEYVENNEQNN